ncbi:MAG TPA: hypothetical protein DIW47_02855 [Bacteroidetes bacterium]|nr:hypothetical protein [Bacteroidota bacterium]
MESLVKSIPYSGYRRYLLRYQVLASGVACLPVFLSIVTLIGLPHLLFVILIGFLDGGAPSTARRVVHGIMFLYYTALLLITLLLWPETLGSWSHADSIDRLIQIQMMLLPLILTIQLGMIAFEWIYPILLPHELLEQRSHTQNENNKLQSI